MPAVLYLLALAVFAMGTSEFMLAGLLPDIAADLGVTLGTSGLLVTAFALGMVVGAPLMAAAARRWPPRTSLTGFVVVFLLAHVAAALSHDFVVVLVTRVVAAVANAGFLAVALATAASVVPADRTGRALAVLLAGTTVATVAGVPGGAVLGDLFGWRSTFWVVAAICVPAALGVLLRAPTRATAADIDLRDELAQLRRPRLLTVLVLGVLVNGAMFASFSYFAPIVTDVGGLGTGWVPVVLVLFGVGAFAGVTVAGRLADARPWALLSLAAPALLAGWIVLALGASVPAVLLPLAFVQGALSFAVGGTLIARSLHEASAAPAMGGSYSTATLNIGAAAGPAAAGATLGASASAPLWLSAGLVATAVAIGATRRTLFPAIPRVEQ